MWQIAAGAAGVSLLFVGLMGWILKGEIESRVKFEVAAQVSQKTLELKEKEFKLSQTLVDSLAEKDKEIRNLRISNQKEIKDLRNRLEKNYAKAPFDTANDVERRIALRMCLYENGNNREGRQACHDRARQPYSPDFSATVAVTPETAEDWRVLCEETGSDDYCRYAVTGFTHQGFLEILQWMDAVDQDQLKLRDKLDAEKKFREQIQKLN